MTKAKRKKLVMEVGKKYKGQGWINEYGQMNFEASQPRENPNNMKLIKETKDYSLYESKNLLKITVTIEKSGDKFARIKEFMNAYRAACVELKNYEIEGEE